METQKNYPLSAPDVAKRLSVVRLTVINWADAGKIPHLITPGGHYRFNEQDVRAFIDKLKKGNPLPEPVQEPTA